MKTSHIIWVGIFATSSAYLLVSAPPELTNTDLNVSDARMIKTENLLNAVNSINNTARTLYTKRIVGGGKAAGLEFGEDWADPDVEKGPLPALFLRLVSARLETKPPQLGLYLGSDEPINKSNLFGGTQVAAYEAVKATQASVFMKDADLGLVAMYPDFASAGPCVSCHNEHADSPKTDWQLGDVMGATTWTYPAEVVGATDYLDTTEAFYDAVEEAYMRYLDQVRDFDPDLPIGADWPEEDKRVLPDAATFMAEVRANSAQYVISDLILDAQDKFETLEISAKK